MGSRVRVPSRPLVNFKSLDIYQDFFLYQKMKAKLSLLVGIICISIFPILIKLQLNTGLISAFYRMFFSVIIIIPIAILLKKIKTKSLTLLSLACLCGVLFASDVAVWNIAIQESSATQASLLTNISPIWVGLISMFILKQKLNNTFWIGCGVALLGMICYIGFDVVLKMQINRALVFGILSGVFYSCYILVSKYVLKKMVIVEFMLYMLLSASIFLAIINFICGEAFYGFSNLAWLNLITQALLCQLLAWGLLSYATTKLEVTKISLTLLSQAFLAGILSWYFLDENITLQMIIGGILIIIGIGITYIKKERS